MNGEVRCNGSGILIVFAASAASSKAVALIPKPDRSASTSSLLIALTKSHGNCCVVDYTNVHASIYAGRLNVGRSFACGTNIDSNGIEKGSSINNLVAGIGERFCGNICHRVDPLRDVLESVGTVIHAIEACHVRQECLCGANVGRCFVATNMLLTRLHRHSAGAPSESTLTPMILRAFYGSTPQ